MVRDRVNFLLKTAMFRMNLPIQAKKNITFAYLSISMQDKTVFFPVWINKF
jgi:hypothetical protein